MDLDTLFHPALDETIPSLSLLGDFVNSHIISTHTVATDDLVFGVRDKFPAVDFEGSRFFFTNRSFYQFCGLIELPLPFVFKVPDTLIISSIEVLLGLTTRYLNFHVRGTTIASVNQRTSLPREEFFDCINNLDGHSLQHAYVSDSMISALVVPNESKTRFPVHKEDGFQYGTTITAESCGSTLTTTPYTFRYACSNIGIGITQKFQYRSKFGKQALENCFERGIDWSRDRIHKKPVQIDDALKTAFERPLQDFEFVDVTQAMVKCLDLPTVVSLLLLSSDEYNGYLKDYRDREKKRRPMQVVENPEHSRWELFNTFTAAAQAFKGQTRYTIESSISSLLREDT